MEVALWANPLFLDLARNRRKHSELNWISWNGMEKKENIVTNMYITVYRYNLYNSIVFHLDGCNNFPTGPSTSTHDPMLSILHRTTLVVSLKYVTVCHFSSQNPSMISPVSHDNIQNSHHNL